MQSQYLRSLISHYLIHVSISEWETVRGWWHCKMNNGMLCGSGVVPLWSCIFVCFFITTQPSELMLEPFTRLLMMTAINFVNALHSCTSLFYRISYCGSFEYFGKSKGGTKVQQSRTSSVFLKGLVLCCTVWITLSKLKFYVVINMVMYIVSHVAKGAFT